MLVNAVGIFCTKIDFVYYQVIFDGGRSPLSYHPSNPLMIQQTCLIRFEICCFVLQDADELVDAHK